MAKFRDIVEKMSVTKKDTKRQIEKIKKLATKAQIKNFNAAIRVLFKEHPDLESFSWTQYTPHWNDGDEISFEANIEYVYINDSDNSFCAEVLKQKLYNIKNKKKVKAKLEKELEQAEKSKTDQWRVDGLKNKIEELEEDPVEIEALYKMTDAVAALLKSLDDDTLEEMFGDHVKVTVTVNGAETEEYEHE
jgi:hypothetical protein